MISKASWVSHFRMLSHCCPAGPNPPVDHPQQSLAVQGAVAEEAHLAELNVAGPLRPCMSSKGSAVGDVEICLEWETRT